MGPSVNPTNEHLIYATPATPPAPDADLSS
jgi:hypothetical protein